MKIIYKTNTGHTLQYAEMLSKKLDIPCYSIKEAKKVVENGEEVIFLGWVFASKIQGLSKMNKYNIKCIGAVGSYQYEEEYIKTLKQSNNLGDNMFYLRGGLDVNKQKGFKKKILQMVASSLEKENKPENQEMIDLFRKGANFVSEDNLNEMLDYIKKE